MALDRSHVFAGLIGAGISAAVQFLAFGATYGRLETSVEDLGNRVSKLEGKTVPGTHLGGLCLKLLDEQWRSTGSEQVQRVEAQLQRFNCYDKMNATATSTTTTETRGENAVEINER